VVKQDNESPYTAQHKVLLGPKDYKRLKHGKDVPVNAELQYLKPQLPAQALVHRKFVMDRWTCLTVSGSTRRKGRHHHVASWPYKRTVAQANFWYVDFTIISHANRCDLQLPVRRRAVKSVNHAMNLQDLFRQLFNHPSTLEDPFVLACVLSSQINAADA
jgi:hypothetical protein